MRQLNGVYTQTFNRRHGKAGHVLQGRFKAILVDRDSYLLELCRYVVVNPVRAKITRKPDTYPWSSYRATAGLDSAPSLLTVEWTLSQFGKQRASAQRRYMTFVAEGLKQPSPWEQLQGQILLGNERFVDQLRPTLRSQRSSKEIPRGQRHAGRPSLAKLFTARVVGDRKHRDACVREAHVDHGYSLSQIGGAVGLHYSTASRIVGS
jgi:putative transposase